MSATVFTAKKGPHLSNLEILAAMVVAIALLIHGNWELSVISIAILFAFRNKNIELTISNDLMQYKAGKVDATINLTNIDHIETKGNTLVGKKLLVATKDKVSVFIGGKKADTRQRLEIPDIFEQSLEEISSLIQARLDSLQVVAPPPHATP